MLSQHDNTTFFLTASLFDDVGWNCAIARRFESTHTPTAYHTWVFVTYYIMLEPYHVHETERATNQCNRHGATPDREAVWTGALHPRRCDGSGHIQHHCRSISRPPWLSACMYIFFMSTTHTQTNSPIAKHALKTGLWPISTVGKAMTCSRCMGWAACYM